MKKNVKVLLMTAMSSMRDSIVSVAPTLGLWRLQQYLIERGIECDVIDFCIDSEEEYIRMAEKGKYDIIGMGVTHHNMFLELGIIWRFRNACKKSSKKCLFIAGGQEATHNYKQWLESGGIDVILLGFAERSLYELCLRSSKASNDTGPSELVAGMDGYAVLDKNRKSIYKPTKILTKEDFREFSFQQVLKMDVPFESYWNELRKVAPVLSAHNNIFTPETVRPYTVSYCPMVCGYCSSRTFLRESQKQPSPLFILSADDVYQLILHYINKYGAKSFLFADDDFLIGSKVGLKRVFDFCKLVIESKEKGTIPEGIIFNSQARIDDFLIKERDEKGQRPANLELIKIMKEAGFYSFGIGVETFPDSLRRSKSMNKVAYNEDEIYRVLDAMLEGGLAPTINIILGIPESTVEELIHTMKAGVECFNKGCQIAVTALMDSFPGSAIHGSKDYKVTYKEWKNPYTGEVVVIEDYFIPNNNEIANIVSQIRPLASVELNKIKAKNSWNNTLTPKGVTAISFFVATAKLLGRDDLYRYFADVIGNVLYEERAASEKAYIDAEFSE